MASFRAWVAYFDVYGFSNMVATEPPELLIEKLTDAHLKAQKLIQAAFPASLYLSISDSLALVFPADGAKSPASLLDQCATGISDVLDSFIDMDLPLRGAAAFGNVTFEGHFLIGLPVVKAVQLEKRLSFPVFAVPMAEYVDHKPRSALDRWGRASLQQIAVRPDGKMEALLVFPSRLEEFHQYIESKLSRYMTYGPEHVAKAWEDMRDCLERHLAVLNGRNQS